ncbi:hypothetical protein HCA73_16305 [Listeria booriae]|uniref:hypothetical protein n=1 Tax=Listeria booriae TaxID=1552123 RepID=UPI001627817E|nr:hypothetical protein [Listeria booriae]MBC1914216.1 hypothetical protein [Listeria booriae]
MTQWHKLKKEPKQKFVVYTHIGLTDEKIYLQDINLFSKIIYETTSNMAEAAKLDSDMACGLALLLSDVPGYGEWYIGCDDNAIQSTRKIYKNVHEKGNEESWITDEEFRNYFFGYSEKMSLAEIVEAVNERGKKFSSYHYEIQVEGVYWEDLLSTAERVKTNY